VSDLALTTLKLKVKDKTVQRQPDRGERRVGTSEAYHVAREVYFVLPVTPCDARSPGTV
jgi:hypothetical protein